MKKVAVAMVFLVAIMSLSFLSPENASADFSLPYTYNGHQYSDVLQNFWVSYAQDWTTTIYYNIPTSGTDIRYQGEITNGGIVITCAKSAVRILQAPQYNGGYPVIDGEWLNEEDTCGLSIGTQTTVGPTVDTSKLYSSQNILEPTGNNIWFYANVSRTPPAPGNLAVSPSLYNFGNLTVGACSAIPTVFTLSNTGNSNINVTDITTNLTVSNNKIFELIYDWGSKPCNQSNPTINPGDNCTVGVAFCPAISGPANDNLVVTSNDPNSPANIQMTGTGQSISSEISFFPPVHGGLTYTGCDGNAGGHNITVQWAGSYGGIDGNRCIGSGGHPGIDIDDQFSGEQVYAIAHGIVVARNDKPSSGFGRYVVIRHDHVTYYDCADCSVFSIYAHMRSIDSKVPSVGKSVTQDQILGVIGNTGLGYKGSTAGTHLHFQIQKDFNKAIYWPKYTTRKGKMVGYPYDFCGKQNNWCDFVELNDQQRTEASGYVQANTINPLELLRSGTIAP